jgi:hypothetical protein
MSGDPGEKRAATRVSYPCEVECVGPGGTTMHLRIADVSPTGAFIDTITAMPEGCVLTLKFSLEGREMVIPAEVCHAMPQMGMGVRFTNVSDDQQAILSRFVAAHNN